MHTAAFQCVSTPSRAASIWLCDLATHTAGQDTYSGGVFLPRWEILYSWALVAITTNGPTFISQPPAYIYAGKKGRRGPDYTRDRRALHTWFIRGLLSDFLFIAPMRRRRALRALPVFLYYTLYRQAREAEALFEGGWWLSVEWSVKCLTRGWPRSPVVRRDQWELLLWSYVLGARSMWLVFTLIT